MLNPLPTQARSLQTNPAALVPLDPQLGVSSEGGFADLLRNFDAAPEPTAAAAQAQAPSPAPAPAASEQKDRPPETQKLQAQATEKIQKTQAADTPAVEDGSEETESKPYVIPVVPGNGAGDLDGGCILTVGELDNAEGDPTKEAQLLPRMPVRNGKQPRTAEKSDNTVPVSPLDPGITPAQSHFTALHEPPTAMKNAMLTTDPKPAASTLNTPSTVDEALSRASERAQGQQQAERQVQRAEAQVTPLGGSTAAPTTAVQSFAAELQASLPAAPRAGTPAVGGLSGATASATAAAASASDEAAAPQTLVDVPHPLDDPAFASALGARLAILAKDGVQKAELHLNPAEMGPVAVQISVDGSQAQVTFHAAHAETRGVLEQGLPDLAAALAANGLTLAGGGVFQQQQQQQGQNDGRSDGSGSFARERDAGGSNIDSVQSQPMAARQRGVVDLYA